MTSLEPVLPDGFQVTLDHEREGFIRCGTMGHAWHDYDSNWKPGFGYPLTLRCERCGTERRDVITNWGKLLSRRYVYPTLYKYPRGTKRPSRDEFRVMLLVKQIQESRALRERVATQVAEPA